MHKPPVKHSQPPTLEEKILGKDAFKKIQDTFGEAFER